MKTNLAVVFMLAAALTGCSNNNESSEDNQVSIQSCYTRSGTDTSIIKDFGLFIANSDGTAYNNISGNIHVTYDGTWYLPKITLGKENGTLMAYSPFDESCTMANMPLDLGKQIDYLYSKGQTVNYNNPNVSIELGHVLSKLTFIVENNPPTAIKIGNYPTTASLNLFKKTINANSRKGTIMATEGNIYVLPGSSQTIDKIVLTYQNVDYDYILPENTFEEGKEYVYNLSITVNHDLTLNELKVSPWISGGKYEGNL